MRIAVYTDYPYRRAEGGVFAERAFVLFLGELARHVEGLTLLGRLDQREGRGERSHYRVAEEIDFVPLPYYESLADPRGLLKGMGGALRRFWRALDQVDAVWLLGPHPLCLAFAAAAALRRRRVFLGVRQDLPTYARARHDRRAYHVVADALEGAYRLLARAAPAVVVGPDLARNYARAKRLLAINVSLVHEADIPAYEELPSHAWEHEPIDVLSVGRLDTEKNPLLMADILAELRGDGRDWRLVVCGEGPLTEPLARRLEELGVAEHADLRGYVRADGGLMALYRDSHALLHVSWTEGVPQVLFEAFANGLPIVATDVGGVAEVAGGEALLVEPGAAAQAAAALRRLAGEPALREGLRRDGLGRAHDLTVEAEAARVACFFAGA